MQSAHLYHLAFCYVSEGVKRIVLLLEIHLDVDF